VKIDLHCHTAEHSHCSKVYAEDLLRKSRQRGLDGIVITDHHHLMTVAEWSRLQLAVPGIKIFRGVEVCVPRPDKSDCEDIVIVTDEPCEEVMSLDAEDVDHVADFVERTGALTILAHPFRYHQGVSIDLSVFRPDAVEIASLNTEPRHHEHVLELAAESGMNLVACSDAHSLRDAAMFCIELDDFVETSAELAAAVRSGAYTITGNKAALRTRIQRIAPYERLAREVLDAGGDVGCFMERGGEYPTIFERVARGNTYLPNTRALGLRGVCASRTTAT